MKYLKIKDVRSPERGTTLSAGIDFFVPEGLHYVLHPGDDVLIPSGIKVKVPSGYALIAFNKSGVATKKGLTVGACVVDEDYQGEIHLHLFNVSNCRVHIDAGEKIIQFILIPVNTMETPKEIFSELDLYTEVSERGDGGFGSTNLNI